MTSRCSCDIFCFLSVYKCSFILLYWVHVLQLTCVFYLVAICCPDAAAQGVQPDQIIFTDVAMKSEHIKRSALADLFLDS